MQRLHSGAPALLAKETGLMGIVESRLRTKRRAARNAAIEARQPAAQPHRPKGEVAQRQVPIAGARDFPRGQQDQPEHGLGHFVLRKNKLRDLADHREPGAETVIALRLVKGLKQFGLWMRTRSRVSLSTYQICTCERISSVERSEERRVGRE